MQPFDVRNLQPPHSEFAYRVRFDGMRLTLETRGTEMLSAEVESLGHEARIRVREAVGIQTPGYVGLALDAMFGHDAGLKTARVAFSSPIAHVPSFAEFATGTQEISIARHRFYQIPFVWHRDAEYRPTTEDWTATAEGRAYPKRPVFRPGTLYRRYSPEIGKTISFRTVEIERDLETFYEWHHQPRVYDLWDLNKPVEELRAYLEKGLRDPHQIPLIVELDGQPIGYFEIYWVAEDRLAPYYESESYDRGFHFLIGEAQALGAENTGQVVRSVMHLLYLEDARTRRIVVEPRADNKKVLKYSQLVPGWKFIKEFDFPHKRAALLMAKREDFFMGGAL